MSYLKRLGLVIGMTWLGLGCVGLSSFSEKTGSGVQAETEAYRVELTGAEKDSKDSGGPPGKRFTFSVFNKGAQRHTALSLSNQTVQVNGLRIVGTRLLVFGELSTRASVVTILDLNSGESVDCIYGYNPALSKTGRYLIYNKFYPRFSPATETSAVYLIYDLLGAPERNRLATVDSKDCERVGYPVYPEANHRQKTYRTLATEPSEVHTLVSEQFLWLDEDQRVLFVDRQGQENRLVVIDLSQGLQRVQIKQVPIDILQILAPEGRRDPAVVAKAQTSFYAVELKPLGPAKVRIKWAPQSYFRGDWIDLDLS